MVVVTDVKPRPGKSLKGTRVCAYYKGVAGRGATMSIRCSKPVTGRYVAIVQSRKQILTLCEVRVFGKRGNYRIHSFFVFY